MTTTTAYEVNDDNNHVGNEVVVAYEDYTAHLMAPTDFSSGNKADTQNNDDDDDIEAGVIMRSNQPKLLNTTPYTERTFVDDYNNNGEESSSIHGVPPVAIVAHSSSSASPSKAQINTNNNASNNKMNGGEDDCNDDGNASIVSALSIASSAVHSTATHTTTGHQSHHRRQSSRRSIKRTGRYRGRSPQVVRTHRSLHDSCGNTKSSKVNAVSVKQLREMLWKDTSLAYTAVAPRSSVKGLVPLQLISQNYRLLLKHPRQDLGKKSLFAFALDLVRLYPHSLTRRDADGQIPFVKAILEWIAIMTIPPVEDFDKHHYDAVDEKTELAQWSFHMLSLALKELKEMDEEDIANEVLDEFIALVPCIIKANVSVRNEATRHRIFMSPIIWQLLVACASNCYEEGKHPLHLVAENASYLSKRVEDMDELIRELVLASPMTVIVADENGCIPFESVARKWVTDVTPTAGDNKDDSSPEKKLRPVLSSSVASSPNLEFALHLLTSIGTSHLYRSTVLENNEERVETLCTVLSKTFASIPNFIQTMLSISNRKARDRIFANQFVSKVILQKESIDNGLLVDMLSGDNDYDHEGGIFYLDALSSALESIQDVPLHRHEVIKKISENDKLLPCMADLPRKSLDKVRDTIAFRTMLDYAMCKPIPMLIVLFDVIFICLLLMSHRLHVHMLIQNNTETAAPFFMVVICCLYFIGRMIGTIGFIFNSPLHVALSRYWSNWTIISAVSPCVILAGTIAAESQNSGYPLNGSIYSCLAFGTLLLWLQIMGFLQKLSLRFAALIAPICKIFQDMIYFLLLVVLLIVVFGQVLYTLTPSISSIEECNESQSGFCQPRQHYLNAFSYFFGTIIWNQYSDNDSATFFIALFSSVAVLIFVSLSVALVGGALEQFNSSIDIRSLFTESRYKFVVELQSYEHFFQTGLDYQRFSLTNALLFLTVVLFLAVEISIIMHWDGGELSLALGILSLNMCIIVLLGLLCLIARFPLDSCFVSEYSHLLYRNISLASHPIDKQLLTCWRGTVVEVNERINKAMNLAQEESNFSLKKELYKTNERFEYSLDMAIRASEARTRNAISEEVQELIAVSARKESQGYI
eukprot:CAMPEP_0116017696 /NCGR_PEP_ID=MMETSP0321-20121206/8204_1 /TAXON_ID=163516 /ORGANISM="Leptocylindrus danicus var. danicus, Strain B650" /LENGTH=1097 /DNA_ID=CAMNT_0003487943 /DNA_START=51 /DNA_END=3344 /DNA_ORIENTATION=+